MVGIGAAFLRDSLDDTLTSKEAAERSGGASAIAMIPMVTSWRKEPGRDRVHRGADVPGRRGYRSLRTSLQFARQAHELRTVLVTSPAAAEGKTSTLANLGAAFAQGGERVALVSCDLRRPRLGAFFDIEEQSGLTTVLLGQQTLEQALQQVPGYDCLWLLGAARSRRTRRNCSTGRGPGRFSRLSGRTSIGPRRQPAGAAGHRRHGALEVRRRHPARGRRRADQAGGTTACRRAVRQASAAVVGVVLNEVTRQSAYGSGYGYGYGYGSYAPDASLVPVQANGSPIARRDGAVTGPSNTQYGKCPIPYRQLSELIVIEILCSPGR